jgi:hypothetical protein
MERRRQRDVVMGAIAALIVGVAGYRMYSMPSATSASTAVAGTTARSAQTTARRDVNGIDLDALHAARPQPVDTTRNPFRFKPKPAPPPPPQPTRPVVPSAPVQPTGPPPPPPIPLKFIGIMGTARTGQVAILSDGRAVYYGRVGEQIEGRYRILRIGVESIDLAYLDGRGSQTIRQTGQ